MIVHAISNCMDYYSTLGVPRNASPEELRKAYKKASMQHHPDRGGDAEEFKKINEAYSTLKEPHKRAEYDHRQTAGRNGNGFNFNTSNNPFGDMFNEFFHQPRSRPQQHTNNRDVTITARIDFTDVLKGKTVIASYRLRSGREENVEITIPMGANHGDTIRYQGLGDDSIRHMPRGNLNVRIDVIHHPIWRRDNEHLIKIEHINVFDLMIGCVIIVNTIDGNQVKLTVPPGTKPGTKLSMSGLGLPNINTRRRGNAYIHIETIMPTIKDNVLCQKVRELKDATT